MEMVPGARLRRTAGRSLIVALALACIAAPPAAGMAGRPGDGPLSSRLAELAKPAVRAAPQSEQAARLSVAPEGPGSLLREGNRVLVEVRFERGAAAGVEDLRAAGARIVHVSRRYQTVTVAVHPARLPGLGQAPRVQAVTEVLAPLVAASSPLASASSCAGAATSEGDVQLRAAAARSSFNLDGAGATVGILSDSFDTAAGAATRASGDIASGDLPGPGNPCGRTLPVDVLDDYSASRAGDPPATDEGRAMAQIVHDLAPGAALKFATAFRGMTAFAGAIRALRAVGADVIVDDVIYLEEPFFQDGPVAVAVNDVTAQGATYFSSAGNNNLIDGAGNDIASWEASRYRDTPCPPALVAALGTEFCMDFNPASGPGSDPDPTFEITVSRGATLTVGLQWSEPWNGVTADLDAFLLDDEDVPIPAIGTFPVVGSFNDNPSKVEDGGTQRPVETFSWTNRASEPQRVRLAINRCFGAPCHPTASETAMPRLKVALLQNGSGVTSTEYPTSSGEDVVGPTIFGHNGTSGAVSVGAVPFNNSSVMRRYSSRGPVTHYFGPVTGTGAAPALAAPRLLAKPDLAATDGGANTFFGPLLDGARRFSGTSAAAPHAAAVAALMREANPSLSPAQTRAALAATARPVGAFGPSAAGAGLVDALGAVGSVALPPVVSITERPPPLSRNRRPQIGFAANRSVAFACTLDADAPQPCASPFASAAPLRDGVHRFFVGGTDLAGRSGQSEVVSFRIDRTRPRVFFRKRPPKRMRTRARRAKAVFRFGSNEKRVRFICRVDRGPSRSCKARFVRRLGAGKHVARVRARDAAGNVTRRPAVYRFRVKRIR